MERHHWNAIGVLAIAAGSIAALVAGFVLLMCAWGCEREDGKWILWTVLIGHLLSAAGVAASVGARHGRPRATHAVGVYAGLVGLAVALYVILANTEIVYLLALLGQPLILLVTLAIYLPARLAPAA